LQAASRVFVCRRECAAASVLRGKTLTEGEFTSPKHFNSRSGIPKKKRLALQAASFLEQGTGIEPAFSAWEADALPMY
jgi:hypothetical protein